MNSKSLWPVALLVPFFIVAVVWSVASVYLFQTPQAQNFVTHAQQTNRIGFPSMERLGEVGFSNHNSRNEALVAHTISQQFRGSSHASTVTGISNYGPVEQRILGQQFAQRGFTQNMGAPMMPSYAPSVLNQRAFMPTAGMDDYLSAVSQNGNFRWSANRMPIHVYISQGGSVAGYRPEFRKMISDAFNEWCNNSHGLLAWAQVNDARKADVICTWTNSPTIKPGSVEAGQTRTLIQTNRDTGEGRIVTAQISILTEFMGKPFSNENMYKTCLHEVGHALGLQGHSDVPSDIMYPTVNATQVAKLKARDLNTLTHLYSETGYTALNSTGTQSPDIGGITPFTGSGGTPRHHRNSNLSDQSGNRQPFGNGMQRSGDGTRPFIGRNFQQPGGNGMQQSDGDDIQPFSGAGIQQRADGNGITRFTGRNQADSADNGNGTQQADSDGITPFTGPGRQQDDSDGITPYNDRGMQADSGSGITPFYGMGMQQAGRDGMAPLYVPGMQQANGGPGAPQWQRFPGQGYGNHYGGQRHHMQGDWARQAAIREYMMQHAAQQNGFYN